MSLTSDNINTTLSDILQQGPGPYLTAVQVVPIFWGSAWADSSNPDPTWLDVTTAIMNLMTSPYMDGLNQYSAVQPANVKIAFQPPARVSLVLRGAPNPESGGRRAKDQTTGRP
jgi:hypothetical protein